METSAKANLVTQRDCTTKFGKLELTCVKSTQDTDSDTWCNKLTHTYKSAIGFGGCAIPGRDVTFYLRTMVECPVGTVDTLDIDQFDIVERLYVPEDGKEMWLKNLLTKRTVA